MEEDLDDSRSVSVKMILQVHDGTVAPLPNRLLVAELLGEAFVAENLRMHEDDEHLLVVGSQDVFPYRFGGLGFDTID
jgi:hypothetical protein